MTFQDGKDETIQDFDALNGFVASVEGTDSQDWKDAEGLEKAWETLPQVVGKIPGSLPEVPSRKTSLLKNSLLQRICILVAVFGLGFLASTSFHNLTWRHREFSEKRNVAEDNRNEADRPDAKPVGEDVLGASLKFDAFSSGNNATFDDLYGTGFAFASDANSFADSIDSPFQSDSIEQNYDDSFPTWADLEPREQAAETQPLGEDSGTESFVVGNPSDRSYDVQTTTAPTNDGFTAADIDASPMERSYSVRADGSANASLFTDYRPSAQVSAPQDEQNFQPFSFASNNNNNYANNSDYTNTSASNFSANNTRYVDDPKNANYNNSSRGNGYSESAASRGKYAQNSYSLPPTSVEYAVEERETPAYEGSIPTFDNPRPEENVGASPRREYVAQTYEESRRQNTTSRPARNPRW